MYGSLQSEDMGMDVGMNPAVGQQAGSGGTEQDERRQGRTGIRWWVLPNSLSGLWSYFLGHHTHVHQWMAWPDLALSPRCLHSKERGRTVWRGPPQVMLGHSRHCPPVSHGFPVGPWQRAGVSRDLGPISVGQHPALQGPGLGRAFCRPRQCCCARGQIKCMCVYASPGAIQHPERRGALAV